MVFDEQLSDGVSASDTGGMSGSAVVSFRRDSGRDRGRRRLQGIHSRVRDDLAPGRALTENLEALRGYIHPFVRALPIEYDDLEDVVGNAALGLLERSAKGQDDSPYWTPKWAVLEAIRKTLKPRLKSGRVPIESVDLAVLPIEPEPEDHEELDALTAAQLAEWQALSVSERHARITESWAALGTSQTICRGYRAYKGA